MRSFINAHYHGQLHSKTIRYIRGPFQRVINETQVLNKAHIIVCLQAINIVCEADDPTSHFVSHAYWGQLQSRPLLVTQLPWPTDNAITCHQIEQQKTKSETTKFLLSQCSVQIVNDSICSNDQILSHFADGIFKFIFPREICFIWIERSLRCFAINSKLTFVYIMAWCQQATSHYLK